MADTGLFNTVYNPDVLTCLANLSNDEVFTPPDIANAMLDMLPQELFRNPDTKFLDPACKSGVFLREIAKRLIVGLEPQFPDLQERIDHIMHHQLYGIAITELTAMLSRRSLYCTKYPENDEFSVSVFDKNHAGGNILYRRIQHTWKDGKCVYCGASESQYKRADDLETHAYEWIHTHAPEEIFKMKFDVIISNPPYQLSDGGNNASAMPIYQKFVEQAQKLCPRYLTMIVPSRWFSGGRGLDVFRSKMLRDRHLRELHDFENAEDCFPGVDIAGGVCYFLWDKQYNGLCAVYNQDENQPKPMLRSLDEYPILVRSNRAVSIIKKVCQLNEPTLDQKVSGQRPFGLRTYARPENVGELTLRWNGGKGAIQKEKITVGTDMIDKWKVIVSRVSVEHAGKANKDGTRRVLSVLELLPPQHVCSETYIVVDYFSDKNSAVNLLNYLCTKFARFLIYQATASIMIAKNNFVFLPEQDFSKPWTDEELYRKYNLNDDEITFIDSMIKPMDAGRTD